MPMPNSNIFGALYANGYDVFYEDKNYPLECDTLERLFGTGQPVRSILDLGCGTGNHAGELSRRGYRIVGLDQSAEMIKIARAKQISACDFITADIRSFDLGDRRFDAVILMFNVIGYIADDDDLQAILQTAHRHLIPGGRLIFDFWYGPAIRKSPPSESAKEKHQKGQKFYRNAKGVLDAANNRVLIECMVSLGGRRSLETHTVRYFDLDGLQRFLTNAGYADIKFGDMSDIFTNPHPDKWAAISWSRAT